jgi:hypothetical protein
MTATDLIMNDWPTSRIQAQYERTPRRKDVKSLSRPGCRDGT